jgi:hypothetical protein
MLHIVLWKWKKTTNRDVYTAEHVNIMARMVGAALEDTPHRILCITDDAYGIDDGIQTMPLWADHNDLPNPTGRHLPNCYRRLKLFDFETQLSLGMQPGDWIAWIDLDTIIVGSLKLMFKRIIERAPVFAGWGVRGTYHQLVYNGSFVCIQCSPQLNDIWSTFDPGRSPRETMAQGYLGSDQGWLSRHFSKRGDTLAIGYPEFASYPREVRKARKVDKRTSVVFFHGSRKPWHPHEKHDQQWINQFWR